MTNVVDTSLWIRLLRDPTRAAIRFLEAQSGADRIVMLAPIRMELLQGCRGETEWRAMLSRLDAFELYNLSGAGWDNAARLYFDLRQAGWTVRSTLDCCIAQACLELDAMLLHDDRDFETIAKIHPLRNRRFDSEMESNV